MSKLVTVLLCVLIFSESDCWFLSSSKDEKIDPKPAEESHVIEKGRSSGESDIHKCTDCDTKVEPIEPIHTRHKELTLKNGDPTQLASHKHKKEENKNEDEASKLNTKTRHKKPTAKPFLRLSRIRIRVNNKDTRRRQKVQIVDHKLDDKESNKDPVHTTKDSHIVLHTEQSKQNDKHAKEMSKEKTKTIQSSEIGLISRLDKSKGDIKNKVIVDGNSDSNKTNVKIIVSKNDAKNASAISDKTDTRKINKESKKITTEPEVIVEANTQYLKPDNVNINASKGTGKAKEKKIDTETKLTKDTNTNNDNAKHEKTQTTTTIAKKNEHDTLTRKSNEADKASSHNEQPKDGTLKSVAKTIVLADRWSRKGIQAVPDVDRLERRLHPTVKAPVDDIIKSMGNMLRIVQHSVDQVNYDYDYIFNATRYKHMTSVREELKHLADENDRVYDVVLEAAQLTKLIYRRAHEQRHHKGQLFRGVSSIQAEPAHMSKSPVDYISLRDQYNDARNELRKAELLKREIQIITGKRRNQQYEISQEHYKLGGRLPTQLLNDLSRKANQTLQKLEYKRMQSDMADKVHLYGHMDTANYGSMGRAGDILRDANDILVQANSESMICKSKGQQIKKMLHEHSPSDTSNAGFDESRMILWAAVDNSKHHAQKLFDVAADIHHKIVPVMFKAEKLLTGKTKGNLKSKMENVLSELKNKMKSLNRVIDTIVVSVDEEHILEQRCKQKLSQHRFAYDGEHSLINCDRFIEVDIVEGSGSDEEIEEGSGTYDDNEIDVNITSGNISSLNDSESIIIDGKETGIKLQSSTDAPVSPTKSISSTLSPLTKSSTPTTTSPLPETTTANDSDTSDDDSDFNFADPLGWFSDEPVEDEVVLSEPKHQTNASLDEIVREKLRNYAIISTSLYEKAKKTDTSLQELMEKKVKVMAAFANFENKTAKTKTYINKWAAEKATLKAMHERVENVKDDVNLKFEAVEAQCKSALEKSNEKVEKYEAAYAKQSKQAETAADPETVKETVDTVTKVINDVKEMQILRQVAPNPCLTLQRYDTGMRANISELRSKIERAKLIASSLQIAVTMKDDGYLSVPVKPTESQLTTRLELTIQNTGDDGPIIGVATTDTGSFVVSMENNMPTITTFDDDDDELEKVVTDSELKTNTWYKLLIERFAKTYNFTVFDMASTAVLHSNVSSTEIADIQPGPDLVYIGGVSNSLSSSFDDSSWHGCIGDVVLNGQLLNLMVNDTNDVLPRPCSQLGQRKPIGTSLVLDGTGMVTYNLDTLLASRRLQIVDIQFNAQSDGIIFAVKTDNSRLKIVAEVKNGVPIVYINYYNSYEKTYKCTRETSVHGTAQHFQVSFKSSARPRISLNGDSNIFIEDNGPPDREIMLASSEDNVLLLGGNDLSDRYMQGCIQSVSLNDKQIQIEKLESAQGASFGQCVESTCVKFTNTSASFNMTDLVETTTIYFTFTFGSMGPVLQYKKGEKFDVTIIIDSEGLNITQTVDDKSMGRISQDVYEDKDVVTVIVHDNGKEVDVTVGEEKLEVDYKEGGGWWWEEDDDEVSLYSVTIGSSTHVNGGFIGQIDNVAIESRFIRLTDYMEDKKYERCFLSKTHQSTPPPEMTTTARPMLDCDI